MNKQNDKELKCITPCTDIKIDNDNKMYYTIINPFVGPLYKFTTNELMNDQYICATNHFNNETNHIFKITKQQPVIDNDFKYCFKSPIDIKSYLYSYYKIKNIDDFIKYLSDNKINDYTIDRLIKFAFITFCDIIEDSIDKWIQIIKLSVNNDQIDNEKCIKIIKTINKKFNFEKEDYKKNILKLIKKHLL